MADEGSASTAVSHSLVGMNRRLLLQASALAVALSPALLLARTLAPIPVPMTLEMKVSGANYILIGTVTGFKSIPMGPIFKVVQKPEAIAAYNKFSESGNRTQEAFEAYKKAYPADPSLFVFQDRETRVGDHSNNFYNLLEMRLEKVAFATDKGGTHMNMHAPYIYFDINNPEGDLWNQSWKPLLGQRVIAFSQGESSLQLPTPFPLHYFGVNGAHVTDHIPIPISELRKVTDIALRLKLSRPAK